MRQLAIAAESLARAADEALAEGEGNSLDLRIARNLLGCALDEYHAAEAELLVDHLKGGRA